MNPADEKGIALRNAGANAPIAWFVVVWVSAVGGGYLLAGSLLWAGITSLLVALVLVPPLGYRDRTVMLPWEVLVLATVPLAGRALIHGTPIQPLVSHLAIAALALIIAVELHVFTAVRMTDWFAVSFVIVTTMATAGLWAVVRWLSDELLGTAYIPSLRALMINFTWATIAGFGAGVVFTLYFRRLGHLEQRYPAIHESRPPTGSSDQESVRLRHLVGLSERRERQVVRVLQLVLVGLLGLGLALGKLGVILNSAVALLVTQLPAVLERDYQLSMDPGLVLWVTLAVTLHAVGGLGPYDTVWWWDHVAHTLSASVVAAIGYTIVQVINTHSEGVFVPERLLSVFTLLFVVAAGVLWEVIEFVAGEATAVAGTGEILIQYGLGDTMVDLVFDIIGGVIVALWGTVYLRATIEDLRSWLDEQTQG